MTMRTVVPTQATYLACELTQAYPVLLAIPPEDRLAYVAQAERAEPLTEAQLVALGFWSGFRGMVLMPEQPERTTQAQRDILFSDTAALAEIARIAWGGKTNHG